MSSPILGTRVLASCPDNGESCLNTVITNVSAIASDQNFPASGDDGIILSFQYLQMDRLIRMYLTQKAVGTQHLSRDINSLILVLDT